MQALLESNIYEPMGHILVIGSCLPNMWPRGFRKIEHDYDMIFHVCLEKTHMNMVVTKLSAIIATDKIKSITFLTVDKSPHCVQLHYITNELRRMMKDSLVVPIMHYVMVNQELVKIEKEALSLSKNLSKLTELFESIET